MLSLCASYFIFIRIAHLRNTYVFVLSKRDKVLLDLDKVLSDLDKVLSHLDNNARCVQKQCGTYEKTIGKQGKRMVIHISFVITIYSLRLLQGLPLIVYGRCCRPLFGTWVRSLSILTILIL